MSSPWYIDVPEPSDSERLIYAHGTVMVISWILLASTGILFARYGRNLRIGTNRKMMGDWIWFQIHRSIQCLVSVATLLGFFLILVEEKGKWVTVNSDGPRIFAHSILGVIIVCCTLLQVWMALFRCRKDSKFRWIFDWMHRSIGLMAFLLSVPTIFLIATESKILPMQQDGLIAILSIWSAWIIIVVILFELIEYRTRLKTKSEIYRAAQNQSIDQNPRLKNETDMDNNTNDHDMNGMKLVLFVLHIIIAISLVIPFIVIIWQQN